MSYVTPYFTLSCKLLFLISYFTLYFLFFIPLLPLYSSSFTFFLLSSYQTPERSTWNGQLRGYYIGYKVTRSLDQFLYKTIDIATATSSNFKVATSSSSSTSSTTGLNHVIDFKFNDVDDLASPNVALRTSGHPRNAPSSSSTAIHHRKNVDTSHTRSGKLNFDVNDRNGDSTISNSHENSVILTGLKQLTEYTILVQAYNSMGAGPQSDEVTLTTLEEGKGEIVI